MAIDTKFRLLFRAPLYFTHTHTHTRARARAYIQVRDKLVYLNGIGIRAEYTTSVAFYCVVEYVRMTPSIAKTVQKVFYTITLCNFIVATCSVW